MVQSIEIPYRPSICENCRNFYHRAESALKETMISAANGQVRHGRLVVVTLPDVEAER